MRASLRLATSSLSARPSRTGLLTGAVALSVALVAMVACAMGSANAGMRRQIELRLGTAEARVRPPGSGALIDGSVLRQVAAWPEVARATPTRQESVSLRADLRILSPGDDGAFDPDRYAVGGFAVLNGRDIDPDVLGPRLIAGRLPTRDAEILIDALLAQRLSYAFAQGSAADRAQLSLRSIDTDPLLKPIPPPPTGVTEPADAERFNRAVGVRVGDVVGVIRLFRPTIELRVVGITEPPPLGGRPQAFASFATLARVSGRDDQYTEIEIELRDGVDADAFVARRAADLPERLLLQTTERITSGVEKNMASSRLGFLLVCALAMLSAAFIIMTGLTTGVAEQQRELAILRCIGATRAHLGASQLVIGLIIGGIGAAVGVPAGIGIAAAVVAWFKGVMPGGLVIPVDILAIAVAAALATGLLGAAWPAWRAARTTPVQAMTSRARPPSRRGLALTGAFGLAGIVVQLVIVGLPADGQVVFWGYATVGLPAMFVGYYLASVPVTLLVTRALAPLLTSAFGLPRHVLRRTIESTPWRHGFTAGAMMAGLALMIAIWTNGGAILRDWLGRIEFPDAFVSGLALTEEAQRIVEQQPFVVDTASVTLHPVETDAFGIRALQSYRTTFVAFEPEPFLQMTDLQWVEGDADYAARRLEEGGAVIVAREFRIAQDLGAGDTFVCRGADGVQHSFEIVGVVTSPGLELVSKFFNIGDEFVDQAMHAVFGSRRDLKERFGVDTIQLIQIDLADDTDDAEAIAVLRAELFGAGVADVGSGRIIREQLVGFATTLVLAFSAVAAGAMLVASFGVANLIVAGIHARRFEFGVLRAIGGGRGLVVRLVVGEAVIVAVSASILGTLIGIQGAWAGQILYRHLLGIDLSLAPPPGPIGAGWLVVLVMTLAAAAPAIASLARRRPRELIQAMRG